MQAPFLFTFLLVCLPFAEFRGSTSHFFLEAAGEILGICEAYGVGNLRYIHGAEFHKLFSTFHAQMAQEIDGGHAYQRLDLDEEHAAAQTYRFGHLLDL